MRRLARRSLAAMPLVLAVGCVSSRGAADGPPERAFRNGVLVSTSLPPLRLQPGSGLHYLGAHPFRIRDLAVGERHVFADSAGARIRRLLLLQFEGHLPDAAGTYNYRLTNPIDLDGAKYSHNVFLFDAQADPAPEGDATRAFLAGRGLEWPREQMMSRFARVVDSARRHELIIFYMESIADAGYTLEQISEDGGIRPEFRPIADSLTARSLRAFTILPPGTGPPR